MLRGSHQVSSNYSCHPKPNLMGRKEQGLEPCNSNSVFICENFFIVTLSQTGFEPLQIRAQFLKGPVTRLHKNIQDSGIFQQLEPSLQTYTTNSTYSCHCVHIGSVYFLYHLSKYHPYNWDSISIGPHAVHFHVKPLYDLQ